MHPYLVIATVAALGLGACAKQEGSAPPVAPAVSAAPTSAAPAKPNLGPNAGKILQLQQAGPYTYAEVETSDGQKLWLAGGHLDAKEGATVQWDKSEEMRNFAAKSLGRTFDRILFVNAWGPVGGESVQVAPHGYDSPPHPPMGTRPGAAPAPALQTPEK